MFTFDHLTASEEADTGRVGIVAVRHNSEIRPMMMVDIMKCAICAFFASATWRIVLSYHGQVNNSGHISFLLNKSRFGVYTGVEEGGDTR
jgi:hypothetical protein